MAGSKFLAYRFDALLNPHRVRSAYGSFALSGLPRKGRDLRRKPVTRLRLRNLDQHPDLRSPSGLFAPLRIEAFNPATDREARLLNASDNPSLPAAASIGIVWLRINVPGSLRFRLACCSSNPLEPSAMFTRNAVTVK